jgi:hypothetical protein
MNNVFSASGRVRAISYDRVMHRALPVQASDYFGPAIGAIAFVLLMSLLKEPARRNFNAIFVGGAMGAYISGGLGLWELAFGAVGIFVAYQGLRSHRFIGVAWLMHSAWDLVHHFYGNPIWPFMETSSFGCFVLDALIAVWFLAGAPSVIAVIRARVAPPSSAGGPSARSERAR